MERDKSTESLRKSEKSDAKFGGEASRRASEMTDYDPDEPEDEQAKAGKGEKVRKTKFAWHKFENISFNAYS